VITVGIGASLTTLTGSVPRYNGPISGRNLLLNFSSAPQFAFLATDFNTLISTTLDQVLDLLCFFAIQVMTPAPGTCASTGTPFVIKGYNVFPMSGGPRCRWQEVGTSNYLYTTATINTTTETFGNPPDPGTVGYVHCPAPAVTKDPFLAYLEISRDGVYYSNNQISVLVRPNCSAPLLAPCPNASIVALYHACKPTDFEGSCSSLCRVASNYLGTQFAAQGGFDAFDVPTLKKCLLAVIDAADQLTPAHKDAIATKRGDYCGPAPTTSAAWVPTASFLYFAGVMFLSW
jgi:hypothetical protein